jgi:uncharacterized damage-inducible protein DinB
MELLMKTDFIENWKEIQKTTLELIDFISEDLFDSKPFPNRFKSFSWEFSCIISTRLGYINGFREKNLDENSFVEDKKMDKSEMREKLITTYSEILQILNSDEKEIVYFGKQTNKFAIISWLFQHEQFHYGKLILYFAKKNIDVPSSLKEMWGESSFKKLNK